MTKVPRWAQNLLKRHPGAEPSTPENPMPAWLEEELRRVPLWYHIREAAGEPRIAPPYHLVEDIWRQPDLLGKALYLAGRIADVARRMQRDGIEHLVFLGCGSAYYNSVLGAFIAPRLADLTAEAVEAWEFYNYYHPAARRTLVVAQSATGSSFEVLDAVRRARDLGFRTLALTNTAESPLEELADETVTFPTGQKAGPDISVIPSRLVMMYLLVVALGELRRPGDGDLHRLRAQLEAIPALTRRFLEGQDAAVQALARKYAGQACILVVGGGPNWFTALEAALKIEEESSTPCRTYQTADYPHMAISLLAPERTTLLLAPRGPSYARLHTCVRTARAAGSPVIVLVQDGDETISRDADDAVLVPGPLDEMLFPIPGTMFGQLYGYHLGVAKGLNPDTLGTDRISHARAWLTSFPLGTH
jgi:glucosamine--fructose-6-phosphate aminotransferase (isomerizing)